MPSFDNNDGFFDNLPASMSKSKSHVTSKLLSQAQRNEFLQAKLQAKLQHAQEMFDAFNQRIPANAPFPAPVIEIPPANAPFPAPVIGPVANFEQPPIANRPPVQLERSALEQLGIGQDGGKENRISSSNSRHTSKKKGPNVISNKDDDAMNGVD